MSYVAGANLVSYNLETKVQRLMPIKEGGELVVAISYSQNKKLIAVCKRGEEVGSCTVFDVPLSIVSDSETPTKKRKNIVIPDSQSKVKAFTLLANPLICLIFHIVTLLIISLFLYLSIKILYRKFAQPHSLVMARI